MTAAFWVSIGKGSIARDLAPFHDDRLCGTDKHIRALIPCFLTVVRRIRYPIVCFNFTLKDSLSSCSDRFIENIKFLVSGIWGIM